MKQKDISILIPTLSRPNLLLKQINFYKQIKAEFVIKICDSTKKPSNEFINKIDSLSKELNLHYYHEPNLDDRQGLYYLIEKSLTKYSAYCGDDDFFIPKGLYDCAKFLEENKDIRVCYGKAITVDNKSLFKLVKSIKASNYWCKQNFEKENVEKRLDLLSENYLVNLFGVHKTEDLLEDYQISSNIPSRSMSEYLKNYLTIARGKGKFLEVPYLIRQTHSNRYTMPQNLVNLLVEDNFAESIPIFISALSETLIKYKTKEKAIILSKKYIKNILFKECHQLNLYMNEKKFSLEKIFNKISRRIYFSIKNKLFKSSKYYKDFDKYIKIIMDIKSI